MNKKYSIVMLFMTILLCLFSACSNAKVKDTLSIYITENELNLKDAIHKFKDTHKDIEIKEKVFYNDKLNEYSDELTSELVSGEGPDLIVTNSNSIKYLSKLVEKGVFHDLNESIENDEKFKLSDYNEKMLDCGIYNGARYIIPINYSIDALFTTKELLDKNDIHIDRNSFSLKTLVGVSEKFTKDNGGNGKYLLNYPDIMSIATGAKLLDIKNKTVQFNSPEFIDILKQYKKIKTVSYPNYDKTGLSDQNVMPGLLSDGKVVMFSSQLSGIRYLSLPYSSFQSEVDPIILPIPSDNEQNNSMARPYEIAAINSKCKNKEAAYEFIKLLLSEEYQNSKYSNGIPVNKKAYDNLIREHTSEKKAGKIASGGFGTAKGSIDIEYISQPLSNKLVEKMNNILSDIEAGVMYDYTLNNFIYEALPAFRDGTKTAEQTARELNDRVKLYLNE